MSNMVITNDFERPWSDVIKRDVMDGEVRWGLTKRALEEFLGQK